MSKEAMDTFEEAKFLFKLKVEDEQVTKKTFLF